MKKNKKALIGGIVAGGTVLIAYGAKNKKVFFKVKNKVNNIVDRLKHTDIEEEEKEGYVTEGNYIGVVFSVLQGIYRGDGTDFSQMTPEIAKNLEASILLVKSITVEEVGGSFAHKLFWVRTNTRMMHEFCFELNEEGKVCAIRQRSAHGCQD